MRKIVLLLVILMLSMTIQAQDAPLANRIAIRVIDGNGEFYDTVTDETFIPRGVNFIDWQAVGNGYRDYSLATNLYDSERLRSHFTTLSERGYNTVRVFFDICNDGLFCINNPDGDGLNPAYIDNMVDMMRVAGETGIYLVFTSNDLPDGGGYWDISNEGANEQFEGYRNAHYLTSQGVLSAETYWNDLLSALIERNAPTEVLLGWSLLNEQWYFKEYPPLSLDSGTVTTANGNSYDLSDPEQKRMMLVESIAHYIEEVSAVIREHDPDTLLTMGFFAPQFPNPTETGGDWYVDTALLFDLTTLDFFDFHAYAGNDLTMTELAENFGMLEHPETPVIMGEVGAFDHHFQSVDVAGLALTQWVSESCAAGFDGWLFWDYFGAPSVIGDAAWGMIEEDNFLLDAFAPVNQPDPCSLAEIESRNFALNRPVTVSRALFNEPAENATDGSSAQWGSGEHAPQWLEIDLEQTRSINEINLQIAQYPEGVTHHQIWAIRSDNSHILLRDFNRHTQDDEILTITLERALADVIGIRVETIASPSWVSWKEITVFGAESEEQACVILTNGAANLRASVSTGSEIVGSLPAGRGAYIDGQILADDGFTWWHLLQDAWVRSDVVNSNPACDTLPSLED